MPIRFAFVKNFSTRLLSSRVYFFYFFDRHPVERVQVEVGVKCAHIYLIGQQGRHRRWVEIKKKSRARRRTHEGDKWTIWRHISHIYTTQAYDRILQHREFSFSFFFIWLFSFFVSFQVSRRCDLYYNISFAFAFMLNLLRSAEREKTFTATENTLWIVSSWKLCCDLVRSPRASSSSNYFA